MDSLIILRNHDGKEIVIHYIKYEYTHNMMSNYGQNMLRVTLKLHELKHHFDRFLYWSKDKSQSSANCITELLYDLLELITYYSYDVENCEFRYYRFDQFKYFDLEFFRRFINHDPTLPEVTHIPINYIDMFVH